MKGLLIKDFIILRQYIKILLVILALFVVVSLGLDNPAVFLEAMFSLYFVMLFMQTFSYDESVKWDHYVQTLPLSKKDIVSSKYILTIMLCIIGIIASFILSSIMFIFIPVEGFELSDHILSAVGVLAVSLFCISVLLPLTFKIGVEKSRLIVILLFAIPTAVVIALDRLGVPLPSEVQLQGFLEYIPVIVIVFLVISYRISSHIYTNKET